MDLGSGGVIAGKENSLNLPGKCKPEDEFGICVVTLSEVAAHGAVLLCELCSSWLLVREMAVTPGSSAGEQEDIKCILKSSQRVSLTQILVISYV